MSLLERPTRSGAIAEDVGGRVRRAARDAIQEAADAVLGVAIPRTPMLTGDLRESADVGAEEPVQDDELGYHQEVSFNTAYAAVQHEGRWETGPLAGVEIKDYTTPGTGPKYLEGPLLEEAPRLAERVAKKVGEALAR